MKKVIICLVLAVAINMVYEVSKVKEDIPNFFDLVEKYDHNERDEYSDVCFLDEDEDFATFSYKLNGHPWIASFRK